MRNRLIQRLQRHARISTLFPVATLSGPASSRFGSGNLAGSGRLIPIDSDNYLRPEQPIPDFEHETGAPPSPRLPAQVLHYKNEAVTARSEQEQVSQIQKEPQSPRDQQEPGEREWSRRQAIMRMHEGKRSSAPVTPERPETGSSGDDVYTRHSLEGQATGVEPIVGQQSPVQASASALRPPTNMQQEAATYDQARHLENASTLQENADVFHGLGTDIAPLSKPEMRPNHAYQQPSNAAGREYPAEALIENEFPRTLRKDDFSIQPLQDVEVHETRAEFEVKPGAALPQIKPSLRADSGSENPMISRAVEEHTIAHSSRAPLDAVVDVQYRHEHADFSRSIPPLPTEEALEGPAFDAAERDELQRTLAVIPSGKPSDSSVEMVLPKRGRPQSVFESADPRSSTSSSMPLADQNIVSRADDSTRNIHELEQAQSDTMPETIPSEGTEFTSTPRGKKELSLVKGEASGTHPPIQLRAKPSTRLLASDINDEASSRYAHADDKAAEIQTDIGWLPSDLWTIVGEKPPIVKQTDSHGEIEVEQKNDPSVFHAMGSPAVQRSDSLSASGQAENDTAAAGVQDTAANEAIREVKNEEVDMERAVDLIYAEIRRRILQDGERYIDGGIL
ncbi:MAG: hypothetical protein H6642_05495 [Caldilineaceae bacterium]|nr:hypothetical protein [Caldilineaceae bacterium]